MSSRTRSSKRIVCFWCRRTMALNSVAILPTHHHTKMLSLELIGGRRHSFGLTYLASTGTVNCSGSLHASQHPRSLHRSRRRAGLDRGPANKSKKTKKYKEERGSSFPVSFVRLEALNDYI
jgi:hypothetical protein